MTSPRTAIAWSPGAAGPVLARDPVRDPSWQELAACAKADPEEFFPDKGGSTREARRVCRSCPVAAECLEFALANNERFGVWGGLSERERRRIKDGVTPALRRCLAGLHVMSGENRTTDGRCRACRNASDRLARARKALAA
jgi:WhiB family redox-sensing transcriptional regulator